MSYSVLHLHTTYSLLDGLSKPEQVVERCKELDIKNCAITDHGNISGCVKFYSAMKKAGIKPILGCELYLCEQDSSIQNVDNKDLTHFIVLSKNLKGWKSLIKLVSESNKSENFYHKPRLSLNQLKPFAQEGSLIAIMGHLGSLLSDKILDGYDLHLDWEHRGLQTISSVKSIFGENNLFLEAQLIDKENLPVQNILTKTIRYLGEKTKTKVICTPDAHYCRKEDSVDQRVLLCNNLKTTFPEINRKLSNNEDVPMGCFFISDNYHIPSLEEMQSLHTQEEIDNTNYVADLVEEYNILSPPNLPAYLCPNNISPDEYLRQLCREGWKKKITTKISEVDQSIYVDRIKEELTVLQTANLSSYFLIVRDILEFVRKNKWLPGVGRGSAAGCLVSYLIYITNIDPIKYKLLFERFYSSGRNIPDIVSFPELSFDDFSKLGVSKLD
jgi:DNA polymerase-3 subunit alpha